MSGWDTSPAAATDDGFKADDTFQADGAADGGEGLQFADENISRHAEGGAGDNGCRNCGDDSHFARPEPRKEDDRECFACHQVGHTRSECPTAPAQKCKGCGSLEHRLADCTANKFHVWLGSLDIKEMPAEDAWKMLEAADNEKDVADIKTAMLHYAASFPSITFEELEQVFRDAEMNTYLIAKQQDVGKAHTIVNFQGKEDQEYVVSIQFSAKPRRAAFAEGYPSDPADNLARLAKAGFPMNNHQQICSRCEEVGHTQKSCTQEAPEKVSSMSCHICNETGTHYSRDCPQERKGPAKKGCRNCGVEGHNSKERRQGVPEQAMLQLRRDRTQEARLHSSPQED
ncbi:hypothetical protein LTR56_005665 [Elasticomyces elasticus]|nr:hypothetical protein LTR56_005665 [Elasticomyces elasticus]KAK3663948.1 hypothetical protein LTR22_005168 [Elasticomyces elasticus]KAK4927406.1 hypothetical protein LTR49_005811 [Elasticomyces elasticus]KAK5763370.1 hypothetical protein LTS12_006545 [Elasticomyces elasticus]